MDSGRASSFQQRLEPVWPENVTGDRQKRGRERASKKGHRRETDTRESETDERKRRHKERGKHERGPMKVRMTDRQTEDSSQAKREGSGHRGTWRES